MSEMGVQPAAEAAPAGTGLTQWERVVDTFTAPSKTFEDIKRGNRSWWLPLIIGALASYILFAAVAQKITIAQVVDNQMRMDPKTQERMANASPEQRAMGAKIATAITEGAFIAGPVIGMIGAAVVALGLWGTINFGFGGRATYGSVFAVSYYAWLPMSLKALLGTIVIYAGTAPESFNIKNFSPTNLGAFLDPVETNKALYALATWCDAVSIWSMVLMGIGLATVAGVKRSSGYIAVFGWWALFLLISVGWAAAMG